MAKIKKITKTMRCVRGPTFDPNTRWMDVCTDEGGVWDFQRAEWRWNGVLLWRRDGPKTEVPWGVFVKDCLGLS